MNNRIVISLYDNISDAVDAVRDLGDHGFRRDFSSLIGLEPAIRMGQGDQFTDDPFMQQRHSMNLPAIGPVYVSGPMGTRMSEVSGRSMPLVDYLMDEGIPEGDAHMYAEAVRRGGILVTVNPMEGQAEQARMVMESHNPVILEDIVEEWHSSGWQRFDPNVNPLDERELDWPANITHREGERSGEAYPEKDWPENIVDPSRIPPQSEEEPSWPHSITAREDEPPEREEEEQETNWPHNITKRDDEEP